MSQLLISQGELVCPERINLTDIYIDEGRVCFSSKHDIAQIETIDASNCYITAGLFDLQVNGIDGCNLWGDPTREQFSNLCLSMLKAGVTAFLPTLITDDLKHLEKNIQFLESMGISGSMPVATGKAKFDPIKLVNLPGIHLEGPYLSAHKPGVHPKEHVRSIDIEELKQLIKPSIKLMTLAPESNNGAMAIEYLRKHNVIPSLGHTNASFDEAMDAFKLGVPVVTHIFNAMPPIHHRQPGAVTAALLNENVYCCVIPDGLHVDPNIVKLLVKTKGKDRVILVTDIASTGTASGGLVGSSINLSQAVSNIVKWGIASFQDAIQMATVNPAKLMKMDDSIGELKEGGRADLIIWDKDSLAIKHVIANGYLII